MATIHGLDADASKPVRKAAGYLVKNTKWLHDDRALADGLPIATGVIEGACRYLVQDRMGRTGARWSLRLRALRTSGDFDDYTGSFISRRSISVLTRCTTPTTPSPTRYLRHARA